MWNSPNLNWSLPVHPILKPVAIFLTLGVSLAAFPQTKAVNRITRAIDDRETVVLQGNVRPLLQKVTDQGRMDGGTNLQISMAFKRTAAQEADLEKLLAEQQDPNSPNYHKWLTPEQFGDRFGISQTDLATVTNWLQSQGFKVERVANSRTQVWFSGPVSKIETVFRTEMHNFQLNGEQHFANATELSIPEALSDVVLGFHNMDNFRPKSHVRVQQAATDPVLAHFTSNLTGIHSLIPDDFATIYDVKPLYTAGFDGTGQTLVVVGQTALVTNGTAVTDIDAFRAAAGLPARTASNFKVTQVPNSGSAVVVTGGDIDESSLDLEWSEGVAKGVNQNFVFVGNSPNFSVFDALQYAIDNNSTIKASVISISYGNCEATLGSSNVQIAQGWAQQANAQGQTISAASGDFAAADCDTSPTLPAQGGIAVDIPGALPYVTSVGGTKFTGDADATVSGSCAAATPFWAQSCTPTSGGTAIQYIPETAWNDTTVANNLDGTGGGASIFFSKPDWQTGTGVPTDGARDVPDVAFNASNTHDSYILCVTDSTLPAGPCASGFRDASSNLNRAGGTSFGAPTFAGLVAILNQKFSPTGQGNVNPTLYAVAASTPSAFHDITTGNNIVPCGAGTPNCPTTGTLQYGFSAGPGYDQVTGLGSIDASALANAWTTGNPTTADYTMFGTISNISAPGGSGSSTITVDARNGFSGTVALTCTAPTSAFISCSLSSSSIVLGGGTNTGTSTVTIKTNVAAGMNRHDTPLGPLFGGGAVFAGVFVLGLGARRRRLSIALSIITIALLLAVVGCSGGSGGGGGGGSTTPAGSYTVTVTGTSGTTSHTTNISVKVL
jgi:subtilase family serine protease